MLMHGPPGCGKTSLARLLATAARANFVEVHAPQIVTAVVGESERRLSSLFAAARAAAPCLLFFDQMEALAPPRGQDTSSEKTLDRLLSLMLVELDGIAAAAGPPLVLLAAASSPSALDAALLRPGRLDVHVQVPPPAAALALPLLRRMTCRTPLAADVDLGERPAETRRDPPRRAAEAGSRDSR